jgi:hypothetical protein
MKTYRGIRTRQGCVVTVRSDDGPDRPLDPRTKLRNHSPAGFEWGYGGSGPAQLALALAADALGDDDSAQDIYQGLKFRLIAALPHEGWTLTEEEVSEAIRQVVRHGPG